MRGFAGSMIMRWLAESGASAHRSTCGGGGDGAWYFMLIDIWHKCSHIKHKVLDI